ncbi:Hypothetical protein PBC10988_40590 [Planctomycetales bacterium 10988]|nr:Hypothetical protein PBC10988_40590 [Planctomycetales bacterium 10988]
MYRSLPLRLAFFCFTTFALLSSWNLVAAQENPAVPEEVESTSPEKLDAVEMKPETMDDSILEEREKAFQKTMSGAILTGHFTVKGRENTNPKAEKYTIASVSKLSGKLWLITARIEYGEKDMQVPIPIEVVWADDTPVLTLTDVTIPGMGTFTTRVLIYRDHYAGYWQHDERGGNLWGTISRPKTSEE